MKRGRCAPSSFCMCKACTYIFAEHGSFILQAKLFQVFHTLKCVKSSNNPSYIHCNVCSSQKNAFSCIAMYEVLAKSKHGVISMLFL